MRRFFLTIKELRSFRYSTKSGVVIQALLFVSSVKTTPHSSTGGLYPDGGWKNLSGCGYERPDRRGRFQWREVGGLTFCPEERGFRIRGVRIKGVLLYRVDYFLSAFENRLMLFSRWG
jgi:hypothetical protein